MLIMDKMKAQRAQEVLEKNPLEKGEPHFCGCKSTERILALGTETNSDQPQNPTGEIVRDGSGTDHSLGIQSFEFQGSFRCSNCAAQREPWQGVGL